MNIFYDFKMARFRKAIYMAIFITFALMNTSCGGSSSELEQQATITSLEATNTALELAVLQATVSAAENAGASAEATPVPDAQPTSTAEIVQTGNNSSEADNDTEISLPAAAPIVPDDALFFEDFSNNDNGWSLAAKDNGSARIARQSLLLSANERDCIIVTIPSFTVEDQYYIQSDIKVEQKWDIVGYAFGNPPNQFYKYGAGTWQES